MTLTYGSLFSGYGGLDLAVEEVFGADCVWHSEVDPNASQVLAAHWPHVPNLGDITAIDWGQVEPVDIICGGFPCQDISSAGRGAGIKEGTRSGLWYRYADAVRVLRPRVVVVENVSALLARGLGIVVGDLAEMGYRVRWGCVRASDAGAPHRRERVFLVAVDADDGRRDGWWPSGTDGAGDGWQGGGRRPAGAGAAPSFTANVGHERTGGTRDRGTGPANRGGAPAHPYDATEHGQRARQESGQGGGPTPDADGYGQRRDDDQGGQGSLRSRFVPAGSADPSRFGPYAAAVTRWERITGRPAPSPTDERGRLNPPFPEWMMGLPQGWVTGHGLTRTAELKMIGNGVVPQQAVLALRLLARTQVLEVVS